MNLMVVRTINSWPRIADSKDRTHRWEPAVFAGLGLKPCSIWGMKVFVCQMYSLKHSKLNSLPKILLLRKWNESNSLHYERSYHIGFKVWKNRILNWRVDKTDFKGFRKNYHQRKRFDLKSSTKHPIIWSFHNALTAFQISAVHSMNEGLDFF